MRQIEYARPVTQRGRRVSGEVLEDAEMNQVLIPVVPKREIDLDQLKREATNPTLRARAAYRMRRLMKSFEEIAEFLDYASVAECKTAVYGIIAATADPKDTDMLRHTIVDQLERSVERSARMAGADYLEDEDGNLFPNYDRLAWHTELRKDLEVLARVSGAQAAAQVQLVTPEDAELDAIVLQMRRAQGLVIEDVSVLELPELEGEIVEDERGQAS